MRRIEFGHGDEVFGIFEVMLDDYHVLRITPVEVAGNRPVIQSHVLEILRKLEGEWRHERTFPVGKGQMVEIRDGIAAAIKEEEKRAAKF